MYYLEYEVVVRLKTILISKFHIKIKVLHTDK